MASTVKFSWTESRGLRKTVEMIINGGDIPVVTVNNEAFNIICHKCNEIMKNILDDDKQMIYLCAVCKMEIGIHTPAFNIEVLEK